MVRPDHFFAVAVSQAAAVEFDGDASAAEPALVIQLEDRSCGRHLRRFWGEFLGLSVDGIAVGVATAGPFALLGFGGHAVDDPVDDGLVFELGEYAEELDEHPTDGGGSVERLGSGDEGDTGVVEFSE